ncbi:MAG: VWA domain-containing protein [Actinomycetota bacterium]|nr:VWA domain-containing protein [Actinomycetota bacterium]
MSFLAPGWLLASILVAALAGAYVVLQRRRRHYAVRFTNLELLASVAPRRPGWRRHVPAAVMALAALVLVVGLARPVRDVRVPKEEATVMLVLDTSASMDATDVAPSRLEAAIDAGTEFVAGLPDRLLVGLVAFDGTPRVVAAPTSDHELVERSLRQLSTGPGTAAGEGLYTALDAIDAARAEASEASGTAAAIVLLSDGVTTVGRPVEQAAAAAAERGVPVTTIAFGTDEGVVEVAGRVFPVPSDPLTMAAVAETSGGRFFAAFSGDELRDVYDDIGTRVGYDVEQREVGMAFVALGAVLLMAALGAALVWTGRIL